MKIIKKKMWPEYFELINSGKKKFELRVADFDSLMILAKRKKQRKMDCL